MKSSTYLPLILILTGANAAALLPRAPQGPDSSPGEFIDPSLSHSNPQNDNSTTSPITYAPAATTSESPAKSSELAAISSAFAAMTTAANFEYLGAVPSDVAAATTLSPAAASSVAAAELNAIESMILNETDTYNGTYGHGYGYPYNGSRYRHHHHNSSSWNSTDFLNITEIYNATDGVDEVVAVEANGTTLTQYYNVTEGVDDIGMAAATSMDAAAMSSMYAAATSGGTAASSVGTGTGTAATPAVTGTNGVQRTNRLTIKPGFTGPKVKREVKKYGRLLSGLI